MRANREARAVKSAVAVVVEDEDEDKDEDEDEEKPSLLRFVGAASGGTQMSSTQRYASC